MLRLSHRQAYRWQARGGIVEMTQDSVTDNDRNGLRRVLGSFDTTCIVVGAIIGLGIFFTPGRVAELAGTPTLTLLVWAVGGLIALAGALTFAELGGLYPRTAGQYHILRDSFGPLPAFLFVFCNATAIQAGAIAVIAMVCVQHLWLACGLGEPQTLGILGCSTLPPPERVVQKLVVVGGHDDEGSSRIVEAWTDAVIGDVVRDDVDVQERGRRFERIRINPIIRQVVIENLNGRTILDGIP